MEAVCLTGSDVLRSGLPYNIQHSPVSAEIQWITGIMHHNFDVELLIEKKNLVMFNPDRSLV